METLRNEIFYWLKFSGILLLIFGFSALGGFIGLTIGSHFKYESDLSPFALGFMTSLTLIIIYLKRSWKEKNEINFINKKRTKIDEKE